MWKYRQLLILIFRSLPQGYFMCTIQIILWKVSAYKKCDICNRNTAGRIVYEATCTTQRSRKITLIAARLSYDPVNIKSNYLLASYFCQCWDLKPFLADLDGKLKKVKRIGKVMHDSPCPLFIKDVCLRHPHSIVTTNNVNYLCWPILTPLISPPDWIHMTELAKW